MLQQFGVEYLTYTIGDNDYRVPRSHLLHQYLIPICLGSPSSLATQIAVQASTIVKKLMERFGLRKS
jgi:hypothetical protein